MSKIESAFAMADLDMNGTLSAQELIASAKTLGINFTVEECKEIVSEIDIDGAGEMTIFDFSHVIGAAVFKNPQAKAEDLLKDALMGMKKQRAMKKQMRERGLKTKMKAMAHMFDKIDSNKDGKLDLPEFTQGVKDMGLEWSDAEIKACLEKIDADGNGTIERNEFNTCFYAACMRNPDLPIDEIVKASLTQMMNKGQLSAQFTAKFDKLNLKKAETKVTMFAMQDDALALVEAKFMDIDKNLDGVIDQKELGDVLTKLGMKMNEKELAAIFKKIDKSGNGKINFQSDFKPMIYETALKHPGWTVDQVLRSAVAGKV